VLEVDAFAVVNGVVFVLETDVKLIMVDTVWFDVDVVVMFVDVVACNSI
jgi:hypothetical protein